MLGLEEGLFLNFNSGRFWIFNRMEILVFGMLLFTLKSYFNCMLYIILYFGDMMFNGENLLYLI